MRIIRKISVTIVVACALFGVSEAQAGCLSGAAVGGVAGHFVGRGHAVAGAAVGCAVGHHRENERRETTAAPAQNPGTPAPTPNTGR